MSAASRGHVETVKFLVETCECNVNLFDKYNRNALIYAVRNGQL
jgi:ankyrin repeat protein